MLHKNLQKYTSSKHWYVNAEFLIAIMWIYFVDMDLLIIIYNLSLIFFNFFSFWYTNMKIFNGLMIS